MASIPSSLDLINSQFAEGINNTNSLAKQVEQGNKDIESLRRFSFEFFEEIKDSAEQELDRIDPNRVDKINQNSGLIQKIRNLFEKIYRIFFYSSELHSAKQLQAHVLSLLKNLNYYKAEKLKILQAKQAQESPQDEELQNDKPERYLNRALTYIDPWTFGFASRTTSAIGGGAFYLGSSVSNIISTSSKLTSYAGSFFSSAEPESTEIVTQEPAKEESIDDNHDFELIDKEDVPELADRTVQKNGSAQVSVRKVNPEDPSLKYLKATFHQAITLKMYLKDGTEANCFDRLFEFFFRPDEMISIQADETGFHVKYEHSTVNTLEDGVKLILPSELKFKFSFQQLKDGSSDKTYEFLGDSKPSVEISRTFNFLIGRKKINKSVSLFSLAFNDNTIKARIEWLGEKKILLSDLVSHLIL